jgi:hypothetical protein
MDLDTVGNPLPPVITVRKTQQHISATNLAIAFHFYHTCRGKPQYYFASLLDTCIRAIRMATLDVVFRVSIRTRST